LGRDGKGEEMSKERYWTVYIGGCEWRITETGNKTWIKKYLQRNVKGQTINGRCYMDQKAIFIRKGLHQQDRYETIVHEILHAICSEHRQNETMALLYDDEIATHILSKGICSTLRQTRDNGMIGGGGK